MSPWYVVTVTPPPAPEPSWLKWVAWLTFFGAASYGIATLGLTIAAALS